MSEDSTQTAEESTAPSDQTSAGAVPEASGETPVTSVEDRAVVRADDGQPVSDEMASAAAVAAVVAIRQVALAYAAHQAEALAQVETTKHDRAGFNAPRRNVRRRLPQTWTQPLGR